MKVKVYMNWDSAQVMGGEDVLAYINKLTDDYIHDNEGFEDWLSDNYTMTELWYLSDEARAEAEKNFREFCHEIANEDFEHTWDVREIEI